MTASVGIIIPCILSIIIWTIYLYGTNEMTFARLIAVLIAGFCPVVNIISLIAALFFTHYSVYTDGIDYTTKCGKIVKFFTKKR